MSDLPTYPSDAAQREAAAQVPPEGVPVLASWGRRVGAYLLDGLLLFVVLGIPFVVALVATIAATEETTATEEEISDATAIVILLMLAAWTVLPGVYFTVAHGREAGQTLGKKWLGLRVIDADRGGSIGYGRSFARWVVPAVVGFFCGLLNLIDLLWPLWDDKNQTIHDKIANSVVVRTS